MTVRKKCVSCCSNNLEEIIDLGSHSFADRFIEEGNIHKSDPCYLLKCSICKDCGFIQNDIITSPEERYVEVEYSYTTANSNYSIRHWNEYASSINLFYGKNAASILEIGSNDGTLLEAFKKLSSEIKVTGVDASPKMIEICKEKNIECFNDIFGSKKEVDYLKNNKYDIIVANNVLNHSESPKAFLELASSLLSNDDSIIVYELPYWKSLVDDQRFDQIYHEHISYFTIQNSKFLLESIGLEINRVEINDYHGGSLRIYCSKKNKRVICQSVINLLEEEKLSKLTSLTTYESLMNQILKNKISLIKKILEAKLSNREVICIGAAAKANTLLTFYGLDRTLIKFITDTSQYKIGKYTPLTRIPIESDSKIKNLNNPLCLITSWNIGKILKEKILEINPTAEILLPHN